MPRHNGYHHLDDEIGDIATASPDAPPWWLPRLEKRNGRLKNDVPPSPKHEFTLPPHHVLCYSGYGHCLIKGDPSNRRGFPVLLSPNGHPVCRLHGDLGENEVSWVLR